MRSSTGGANGEAVPGLRSIHRPGPESARLPEDSVARAACHEISSIASSSPFGLSAIRLPREVTRERAVPLTSVDFAKVFVQPPGSGLRIRLRMNNRESL